MIGVVVAMDDWTVLVQQGVHYAQICWAINLRLPRLPASTSSVSSSLESVVIFALMAAGGNWYTPGATSNELASFFQPP